MCVCDGFIQKTDNVVTQLNADPPMKSGSRFLPIHFSSSPWKCGAESQKIVKMKSPSLYVTFQASQLQLDTVARDYSLPSFFVYGITEWPIKTTSVLFFIL